MMQQKTTATDDSTALNDQQKLSRELEKTAVKHVLRFGALANTGGVAACLSILGASASTGAVEKVTLVPLIPFLLGILSVWLSLIILREQTRRQSAKAFGREVNPAGEKLLHIRLVKNIWPLYEKGILASAPFMLFCLGVLLGFIVILAT